VKAQTLDNVRADLNARRALLLERQSRVDNDLKRRSDPLVADSADQAIQLQNDEVLEAIGKSLRKEITDIDEALERLKLNLYGICHQCGQNIPDARLAVTPSATHCATCGDFPDPE